MYNYEVYNLLIRWIQGFQFQKKTSNPTFTNISMPLLKNSVKYFYFLHIESLALVIPKAQATAYPTIPPHKM
jgi:hypothetical protein